MSERKVLNKYFPPDFDPSKIPRRKIPKDQQQVVRLMAPFTMCCTTCGEFIYKGKKFNAKKELAAGEEYYNIKVFRFYIKCTRCSAEITFKTDPKNADYIAEHGATRNYEPTTEEARHMPNAADDDEANGSEDDDPMKALEESQAAAKRQMEAEDELADLRQRNARISRNDVDSDTIIAAQHAESVAEAERRKKEQEEEDEIVKKYFYKVQAPGAAAGPGPSTQTQSAKVQQNGAVGGLGSYGDSDEEGHSDAEGGDADDSAGQDEASKEQAVLTVKRKPPPSSASGATYEPTVAELLASKGITLPSAASIKPGTGPKSSASAHSLPLMGMKTSATAPGVKRKDLASTLGIKVALKKKKV